MSELRWHDTNGKRPRTGDKLLHVRFRNGLESKQPYRADQMKFAQVGSDWDVMAVARVPAE